MINEALKEQRKKLFDEMESMLHKGMESEEDSLFAFHPSEDRIVLSHAIAWVMSKSLKGKITKEKFFLMLRQYQEEMLLAYLTEDDYFPELLRYCNILFEYLPMIVHSLYNIRSDKNAAAFCNTMIVAAGLGGDMPDDLANEILDDMDIQCNKVKCSLIEGMLPMLNELVARQG